MAAHNEPYDPYIPANGGAAPAAGSAAQGSNPRTAALQAVRSSTFSRELPVMSLNAGRSGLLRP
jgi:hypothetical protein